MLIWFFTLHTSEQGEEELAITKKMENEKEEKNLKEKIY